MSDRDFAVRVRAACSARGEDLAMDRMRIRLRNRRGGITTLAIVGATAMLITLGVEMDAGRLFVTHHRDQGIADAATMAAALKLPRQDQATTAANLVLNQYRAFYNRTFSAQVTFITNAAGLATSVKVDVRENVPMFLPALMGSSTRGTHAAGTASRTVPSAVRLGVVPIGIQYDATFDIPANGYASPAVVTLKSGSGSANTQPGNFGALSFPGNPGARAWSTYLKLGDDQRLSVNDWVDTKPGNMVGPTDQAMVSDSDSRFNRANVFPYNADTYQSFHPGNPKILILPLVDWTGINGRKPIQIKGFAAFFADSVSGGQITGHFIRYTVSKTGGPEWDGVSIDPTTSNGPDYGLSSVSMTN